MSSSRTGAPAREHMATLPYNGDAEALGRRRARCELSLVHCALHIVVHA